LIKNRLFWQGQMGFAVAGWLFIFWGLLAPVSNPVLAFVWWTVLLLWAVGHPLELAMALPIGKKAGLSLERTIAMTLVFGITWWIPLKLGVFDR
jgi:hypothetical protein